MSIDDVVFYYLGLNLVWHDQHGHWIPDEYRYRCNETVTTDWYDYAATHGITWELPPILPTWAIIEMDQYYRDKYYGISSEEEDEEVKIEEMMDIVQL